MTNRRKITIPALLLVFVLIVDRLVKWWTLQNLAPIGNPGRESIPGLFKLIYVENRGVAFGLFPDNSLFFAVLSTLIIVGIIWRSWGWFWRTDVLARCSAALIVAGGMGNILDRVLYGFVVDMFHIIPLPIFQVFNVADLAISTGAVLLFVALWREDAREKAARRRQDSGIRNQESETGL